MFCATTDELKAESGLSRGSMDVALIALESSCGILRHHRVGEGVTANKLWQRCEVPTPPSSLNAYMVGRGHVARDVNRAMMLELFVKEVGAEAASAFFAASAPLTSAIGRADDEFRIRVRVRVR